MRETVHTLGTCCYMKRETVDEIWFETFKQLDLTKFGWPLEFGEVQNDVHLVDKKYFDTTSLWLLKSVSTLPRRDFSKVARGCRMCRNNARCRNLGWGQHRVPADHREADDYCSGAEQRPLRGDRAALRGGEVPHGVPGEPRGQDRQGSLGRRVGLRVTFSYKFWQQSFQKQIVDIWAFWFSNEFV